MIVCLILYLSRWLFASLLEQSEPYIVTPALPASHHLEHIFAKFWNERILGGIGLRLDFEGLPALALDDGEVLTNQDRIALAVRFAISLVGRRLERGLPLLRGWPRRCALVVDPTEAEQTLAQLHRDNANHIKLEDSGCAFVRTVRDRSLFHSLPLKVAFACCKVSGFERIRRLVEWLSKKHRRLNASMVSEQGFQVASAAVESSGNKTILADNLYYK